MASVTVPADSVGWLPTSADAETKVTAAGKTSVITTPVAGDGPLFVTLTV